MDFIDIEIVLILLSQVSSQGLSQRLSQGLSQAVTLVTSL